MKIISELKSRYSNASVEEIMIDTPAKLKEDKKIPYII